MAVSLRVLNGPRGEECLAQRRKGAKEDEVDSGDFDGVPAPMCYGPRLVMLTARVTVLVSPVLANAVTLTV